MEAAIVDQQISDAELDIMKIIWANEGPALLPYHGFFGCKKVRRGRKIR